MGNLKNELVKRFGMDGSGELTKTNWLGRDNSKVTVQEFEAWSGAKLNRRQSNKYGSEDCKITLVSLPNDGSDELEVTLEIKDECITHSYY